MMISLVKFIEPARGSQACCWSVRVRKCDWRLRTNSHRIVAKIVGDGDFRIFFKEIEADERIDIARCVGKIIGFDVEVETCEIGTYEG